MGGPASGECKKKPRKELPAYLHLSILFLSCFLPLAAGLRQKPDPVPPQQPFQVLPVR